MTIARLVRVATLVSLALAPRAAGASPTAGDVTRVFLVRHAERLELAGVPDPPLTLAGSRRAAALGRLLRSADVATVFATQFLRCRATAESVSVATGAPVAVMHSDSSAALARTVRGRFRGRTVVIVGHSDSLPHVLAELGWEGREAVEPWSYDDLGLLELRGDDPPQFVHLHYGGAADTTGTHGVPATMKP
jgi:phosphohistidine phosphatase SixA